jgi:two-component system NarL family sensor kinase
VYWFRAQLTDRWWLPLLPYWWMTAYSRLFRELVSNIIRHAGANEVEFSIQRAGNRWLFVLADNGCGFDPLQASGTGMGNLRVRAAELGAELAWSSRASGGVQVTLSLPASPTP